MGFSFGTSHFASRHDADRYYRGYGEPDASRAIEEGAISIGKPELLPGQTLRLNDSEGRYFIDVDSRPVQTAAPKTLTQEVALLCAEDGKIVLPEVQLTHYTKIKRLIESSSGSYNSRGYFDFPPGVDVDSVLITLNGGKALNGKKQSQSFFTPDELGDEVCRAAGDLCGRRVLEPSAGDGALADKARAAGADVVVVENYSPNVLALSDKGYEVVDKDFLSLTPADIGLFDVIIANPPFTKNQDIDHVLHMWSFLKPGGVLSVVTSRSWVDGHQKKQDAFRSFLDEIDAEQYSIEAGVFRESGTDVATMRLRLVKPIEETLYDEIEVLMPPAMEQTRFRSEQMGFAF